MGTCTYEHFVIRPQLVRLSFQRYIHKKVTHEEREELEQHICNFYYDSAKKSIKTTVNYFKKQNVPQY